MGQTTVLGVDVTETIAGTGSSNDEGNEFSLGTIATFDDGDEYIYCHAAEAHTANDVIIIDEDYETVRADTTSSASARGDRVGVAEIAVSDNDFFWAKIRGATTINVGSSAAANTELNTTATGGRVDDDATAGAEVIDGLFTTGTEASNAATGMLNYPIVGRTL